MTMKTQAEWNAQRRELLAKLVDRRVVAVVQHFDSDDIREGDYGIDGESVSLTLDDGSVIELTAGCHGSHAKMHVG